MRLLLSFALATLLLPTPSAFGQGIAERVVNRTTTSPEDEKTVSAQKSYVVHVMTHSREFQQVLDSFGVTSHLVRDVSLNIEGATWTTNWGGNFSPYSVSAHQINLLSTSNELVLAQISPG